MGAAAPKPPLLGLPPQTPLGGSAPAPPPNLGGLPAPQTPRGGAALRCSTKVGWVIEETSPHAPRVRPTGSVLANGNNQTPPSHCATLDAPRMNARLNVALGN